MDCLTHTSKAKLDWKTSKGMLTGSAVDISVFRYTFWQPLEYIDPSQRFPAIKWKKVDLLGLLGTMAILSLTLSGLSQMRVDEKRVKNSHAMLCSQEKRQ
eukprot:10985145-Ditylum_brightwellii.AAC.1